MSDQIAQMWNVGHIIQCLRAAVKAHWSEGLAVIFGMRRVKQLVMSINDPANFLSFTNELIGLFFAQSSGSKRDQDALMASLSSKPYAFLKCMLLMYQKSPMDEVLSSLENLERDQLPFFKYEVGQIFKQFDPSGVYQQVRK